LSFSQEVKRRDAIKDALLALGDQHGRELLISHFLPKVSAVSEHCRRNVVRTLIAQGLLDKASQRMYRVMGSAEDFKRLAHDDDKLRELIWPSPQMADFETEDTVSEEEPVDEEIPSVEMVQSNGQLSGERPGDIELILRATGATAEMVSSLLATVERLEKRLEALQETDESILDHLTRPAPKQKT
jgi:hypothetical protein